LFLLLLKRFAGLAAGAYVLVGWIGLQLVGSGFQNALHPDPQVVRDWHAFVPRWLFHVPLEMADWLFWSGMAVIVVVSLLYRSPRKGNPDGLVEVGEGRGSGLARASDPNPFERIAVQAVGIDANRPALLL